MSSDHKMNSFEISFSPGDRLLYESSEVVSIMDIMPNNQMRVMDRHTGTVKVLDQGAVRYGIKKGKIKHIEEVDEEVHDEGKTEEDFGGGDTS